MPLYLRKYHVTSILEGRLGSVLEAKTTSSNIEHELSLAPPTPLPRNCPPGLSQKILKVFGTSISRSHLPIFRIFPFIHPTYKKLKGFCDVLSLKVSNWLKQEFS